jgi:hypothetical protein
MDFVLLVYIKMSSIAGIIRSPLTKSTSLLSIPGLHSNGQRQGVFLTIELRA